MSCSWDATIKLKAVALVGFVALAFAAYSHDHRLAVDMAKPVAGAAIVVAIVAVTEPVDFDTETRVEVVAAEAAPEAAAAAAAEPPEI